MIASARTPSGRARALRRGLLFLPFALLAMPRTAHAEPDPPGAAFDRPFYAGVFLGDHDSRTETITGALDRFGRLVGKRPALVKTFHRLGDDFAANGWAGELVRRVAAEGSTPFLALDLAYAGSPRRNLLDAVVAGRADPHLVRMARGLASVEGTVLLTPGWEMNGNWSYPWQGVYNGDQAGPAKYRAAWRRMVEIFRREGAGNVRWVFSPNVGNALTRAATGPSHWNWYGHYYPGNEYVDFIALHGYNGPGVWGSPWKPFSAIFDGPDADHALSDVERRFPGKPVLIGEFATQEAPGEDKAAWIAEAFETLRRHRNVIGAVWFHMDKEADWRVDTSRPSLDAYRTVLRDPNVRAAFAAR